MVGDTSGLKCGIEFSLERDEFLPSRDCIGLHGRENAGGGFGKFDFQATGIGSSRTQVLTFSIAGVVGDDVNSYAIGYTPESEAYFASHIAGYDDGVSGNTSGKFASAVPVPAAVWLFGSALGMLGWMRRRSSGAVS